ncbi:50S ribosomal protein L44e [Candidatus Woesearchaeota archaeon]|jgi:large subunit ribosomal protein L44e|nr:50S ribosomal protein L44e [Candidatus Woesearchaeota archaeon]
MKLPKLKKRHCPYCKKHTEHKVSSAKRKTPGSARPMGYGSKKRARRRGAARGTGNLGRYSKKAVGAFKMTGKKTTTKTDLRYECKECKKIHTQGKGFRVKRVEFT